MSLYALDQEFSSLRGILDDPACTEADLSAAAWRIDELVGTINVTPPESLADCAAKLRLLADRELGMAAGDRDDDFTSLHQVIAFLDEAAEI
jgi:hypothetical protein